MSDGIQTIPLTNLLIVFVPVLLVIAILWRWSLRAGNALYAVIRMLGQLLLVGYVLTFIFESDNLWLIIAILAMMVFASSWIALGSITDLRRPLYGKALLSTLIGGGSILVIVTQGVLDLTPWYLPQYIVPLAGMIFASTMNCVSLSGERMNAEMRRDVPYLEARNIALQACLIPVINSLFAVGLVSLPGMMTGQILSGVSPLIAVRYQIMVMCMLFGTAGIAAACFLVLSRPEFERMATPSTNENS